MSELTLEEEQAIRKRCQKQNTGQWENGLTMYDCPICTKRFVIHDQGQWVYKRRARVLSKAKSYLPMYLCSYKCCRVYDRIFDK